MANAMGGIVRPSSREGALARIIHENGTGWPKILIFLENTQMEGFVEFFATNSPVQPLPAFQSPCDEPPHNPG